MHPGKIQFRTCVSAFFFVVVVYLFSRYLEQECLKFQSFNLHKKGKILNYTYGMLIT